MARIYRLFSDKEVVFMMKFLFIQEIRLIFLGDESSNEAQNLFRRWLEEDGSRMWDSRLANEDIDDSPYGRIPFQLWSVTKYGSCVDAAIVGMMPPPLLELQVNLHLNIVLVLVLKLFHLLLDIFLFFRRCNSFLKEKI